MRILMQNVFQALKGTTVVFRSAIILILIAVLLGVTMPMELQRVTQEMRDFITYSFGWLYLLLVICIVALCAFFIFSTMGRLHLGEPGTKPEYSTGSWLSMLFSAGMGIGLVFFGAAEPLSHYAISAPDAEPLSRQALADALRYSFFHWGIHAWAIYAIVALAIAYFTFRKQERCLLSATLKPLLGRRMDTLCGKVVDTITVIATAMGIVTTLGFGAAQIGSGLSFLSGIPNTITLQFIIIGIATILFLLSTFSGVGKGVLYLSKINTITAAILLGVVLAVGPTVHIMNAFIDTTGAYLQHFIRMSFRTAAFNPEHNAWIQNWTILYWAWWLSWSPFVGVFIARISKGRTIREFLTYVVLIPTLFSFLWFSVFGILGIDAFQLNAAIAELPTEQVLFGAFAGYPLGTFLSVVTVLLIGFFFITSADSATYVLAMISEGGNFAPHNITKGIWGILVALMAAVLLMTGGLSGLQNMLMIAAFPFSFIVILMMIALYIELSHELKEMGFYVKPENCPEKDAPFRSYEN